MTRPAVQPGVVFLANDAYLPWTRPFLQSFRRWNPDTPLALIPYDDRIDDVLSLADRYAFDVVDAQVLAALDGVGATLLGDVDAVGFTPHIFRKLACFSAGFDPVLYLDADIVVTADVSALFPLLEPAGVDLAFAHAAALEAIFHPGTPTHAQALASGAATFNTGAFLARASCLPLDDVAALASTARDVSSDFVSAGEQPFLNWAMHRRGATTAGLSSLLGRAAFLWAGEGYPLRAVDGPVGPVLRGGPTDVVLVHWAGFRPVPSMPHRDLWRWYRWPGPGVGASLRRLLDRCHPSIVVARARRRLRPGSRR